eukprot:CAMPEP_0119338176 /NCGR_PEP_ID=MMETSP1333-20130426/95521_1 /TAXON_ID=418940 /ORGANISM="Scyphosphaera apsteinii, Strain RCC1455" /LENGTH=48 /DNA_ID= /DNA_START= /DNA_END= /DNA_ORIENTATION=
MEPEYEAHRARIVQYLWALDDPWPSAALNSYARLSEDAAFELPRAGEG